ncbi:MAG: ATP-binding protein [Phycisphaeraceae bacterium]
MSERYEIELRIFSHPRYLCVVRAVIETALKRLSYGEELRGRLALAVDEAITNIIRHGYKNRENGPIWLTLTATDETDSGGGVSIVLEDEAEPVDPVLIRGRDLADIKPGGLGVHIIQQVMHEVRYQPRPQNNGMKLTMIRHASTQNAAADGRNATENPSP